MSSRFAAGGCWTVTAAFGDSAAAFGDARAALAFAAGALRGGIA